MYYKILTDTFQEAKSYLADVKEQSRDQPGVYNEFLKIAMDFKSGARVLTVYLEID